LKIVIEPNRLNKLLSTVLIYKTKPLLDAIVGEFTPKGVAFRDMRLEVAAVYVVYPSKYFIEYDVKQNEEIPLTNSLRERLGWGFKDEKITLMTNEGRLVLQSSKESYSEPLTEVEKSDFPIEMQNTEFGYVPTKEPKIRALLPVDELALPSAEKYKFECTGEPKTLRVTIEDVGKYTKTIQLSKAPIMNEVEATFDGTYFQQIISNITGEVWVSMTEGAMVFSQKTNDFTLTYMLSSIEER